MYTTDQNSTPVEEEPSQAAPPTAGTTSDDEPLNTSGFTTPANGDKTVNRTLDRNRPPNKTRRRTIHERGASVTMSNPSEIEALLAKDVGYKVVLGLKRTGANYVDQLRTLRSTMATFKSTQPSSDTETAYSQATIQLGYVMSVRDGVKHQRKVFESASNEYESVYNGIIHSAASLDLNLTDETRIQDELNVYQNLVEGPDSLRNVINSVDKWDDSMGHAQKGLENAVKLLDAAMTQINERRDRGERNDQDKDTHEAQGTEATNGDDPPTEVNGNKGISNDKTADAPNVDGTAAARTTANNEGHDSGTQTSSPANKDTASDADALAAPAHDNSSIDSGHRSESGDPRKEPNGEATKTKDPRKEPNGEATRVEGDKGANGSQSNKDDLSETGSMATDRRSLGSNSESDQLAMFYKSEIARLKDELEKQRNPEKEKGTPSRTSATNGVSKTLRTNVPLPMHNRAPPSETSDGSSTGLLSNGQMWPPGSVNLTSESRHELNFELFSGEAHMVKNWLFNMRMYVIPIKAPESTIYAMIKKTTRGKILQLIESYDMMEPGVTTDMLTLIEEKFKPHDTRNKDIAIQLKQFSFGDCVTATDIIDRLIDFRVVLSQYQKRYPNDSLMMLTTTIGETLPDQARHKIQKWIKRGELGDSWTLDDLEKKLWDHYYPFAREEGYPNTKNSTRRWGNNRFVGGIKPADTAMTNSIKVTEPRPPPRAQSVGTLNHLADGPNRKQPKPRAELRRQRRTGYKESDRFDNNTVQQPSTDRTYPRKISFKEETGGARTYAPNTPKQRGRQQEKGRSKSADNSESRSRSRSQPASQNQPPGRQRQGQKQYKQIPCTLCDKTGHPARFCMNVTDPRERSAIIHKKRLCRYCGFNNHDTNDCKWAANCTTCGNPGHGSFVCFKGNNGKRTGNRQFGQARQMMTLTHTSHVQEPVKRIPSTGGPMFNLDALTGTDQLLILEATARCASDQSGKRMQVTILLDEGSSATFVTQSAAKRLNLTDIGSSEVQAFGATGLEPITFLSTARKVFFEINDITFDMSMGTWPDALPTVTMVPMTEMDKSAIKAMEVTTISPQVTSHSTIAPDFIFGIRPTQWLKDVACAQKDKRPMIDLPSGRYLWQTKAGYALGGIQDEPQVDASTDTGPPLPFDRLQIEADTGPPHKKRMVSTIMVLVPDVQAKDLRCVNYKELPKGFKSIWQVLKATIRVMRWIEELVDRVRYMRLLKVTHEEMLLIRRGHVDKRTKRLEQRIKDVLTPVTSQEIQDAHQFWLYTTQQKYLAEELTGKHDAPVEYIQTLKQSSDGLYRGQSQLIKGDNQLAMTEPVYLPDAFYTKLILKDIHERHGHCSADHLDATAKLGFWIHGCRLLCERTIKECQFCTTIVNPTYRLPVINEPTRHETKLIKAPAYDKVGANIVGPVTISDTCKIWIMMIVCFVTRAVHFETIHSLDVTGIITALTKFAKENRMPSHIVSGTPYTFNTAARLFTTKEDTTTLLDWSKEHRIKWSFIGTYNPWKDDNYQRIVITLKATVFRIANTIKLNTAQLKSRLRRAQRIINNRPLVNVKLQDEHTHIIRPIDLLLPHYINQKEVDRGINEIDEDVDEMEYEWNTEHNDQEHNTEMARHDNVWASWNTLYIAALHQKEVGHSEANRTDRKKAPSIGEVCLIKEARPRHNWPVARITGNRITTENTVEECQILERGALHIRPVTQLHCLEVNDEDEMFKMEDVTIEKEYDSDDDEIHAQQIADQRQERIVDPAFETYPPPDTHNIRARYGKTPAKGKITREEYAKISELEYTRTRSMQEGSQKPKEKATTTTQGDTHDLDTPQTTKEDTKRQYKPEGTTKPKTGKSKNDKRPKKSYPTVKMMPYIIMSIIVFGNIAQTTAIKLEGITNQNGEIVKRCDFLKTRARLQVPGRNTMLQKSFVENKKIFSMENKKIWNSTRTLNVIIIDILQKIQNKANQFGNNHNRKGQLSHNRAQPPMDAQKQMEQEPTPTPMEETGSHPHPVKQSVSECGDGGSPEPIDTTITPAHSISTPPFVAMDTELDTKQWRKRHKTLDTELDTKQWRKRQKAKAKHKDRSKPRKSTPKDQSMPEDHMLQDPSPMELPPIDQLPSPKDPLRTTKREPQSLEGSSVTSSNDRDDEEQVSVFTPKMIGNPMDIVAATPERQSAKKSKRKSPAKQKLTKSPKKSPNKKVKASKPKGSPAKGNKWTTPTKAKILVDMGEASIVPPIVVNVSPIPSHDTGYTAYGHPLREAARTASRNIKAQVKRRLSLSQYVVQPGKEALRCRKRKSSSQKGNCSPDKRLKTRQKEEKENSGDEQSQGSKGSTIPYRQHETTGADDDEPLITNGWSLFDRLNTTTTLSDLNTSGPLSLSVPTDDDDIVHRPRPIPDTPSDLESLTSPIGTDYFNLSPHKEPRPIATDTTGLLHKPP